MGGILVGRRYDVFISFKNSDDAGRRTKDSELAEKCYHYLTGKGLSVFYSNIELEFIGKSQYSKVIDDALDSSRFLIAVGCNPENLNTQWVRYEWESFFNDIRANIKPHAEVFVLYQDVAIADLPRALRHQQAFNADNEDVFEKLYKFISSSLSADIQPMPGRTQLPVVERRKVTNEPEFELAFEQKYEQEYESEYEHEYEQRYEPKYEPEYESEYKPENEPIDELELVQTPGTVPAFGQTLEFGGYIWRVLDIQDNHALIITEDIIFNRKYHNSWTSVTWASSDIRRFLNSDFLRDFSPADRACIRETAIVTENNPWSGTPGGAKTMDMIFLLSLEEVVQLFGDSGQYWDRTHPDNKWWGFHDKYSGYRVARNLDGSASWWWLRSPGGFGSNVAIVGTNGVVRMDGNYVFGDGSGGGAGVRPALWLNLET